MPTEGEPRYSLTELADLAGVTPRTVRYYISQGLLAVDVTPGPGPKYDDSHLARLRLIKRLQREHQPLAEIRRQLERLDDATVLALSDVDPAPPPAPTDSALEYIQRLTGGTTTTHRLASTPRFSRSYPDAPAALAVPAFASRAPEMLAEPRAIAEPVAASMAAPPTTAPTETPPNRIERSQWERIELEPDVELHIRRPTPRATAKRVERLIAIARDLFREDPS